MNARIANLGAAEVVAGRRHTLLDFDGPVCVVFDVVRDRTTARALVELLGSRGVSVPAGSADTPDPFEMLRYAATVPGHEYTGGNSLKVPSPVARSVRPRSPGSCPDRRTARY